MRFPPINTVSAFLVGFVNKSLKFRISVSSAWGLVRTIRVRKRCPTRFDLRTSPFLGDEKIGLFRPVDSERSRFESHRD